MTRGRGVVVLLGAVVCLAVGWSLWSWLTYPSDRTPDGAYLRIVMAVNRGKPKDFFAYLETRAQHACYTFRGYRKKSRDRVLSPYREPERSRPASSYEAEADAPDGADVFALYAERRGWMRRLRRDMSGIAKTETQGERATIETARGTRYPMRRRHNGSWGLTLFTSALEAEAERAARDAELIDKAASDYERVRRVEQSPP